MIICDKHKKSQGLPSLTIQGVMELGDKVKEKVRVRIQLSHTEGHRCKDCYADLLTTLPIATLAQKLRAMDGHKLRLHSAKEANEHS